MSASNKRFVVSLLAVFVMSGARAAATTDTAKELSTATSGSGKAQLKAIDQLGVRHENASAAVPKLRELLKSDDVQVRWRAARALGDYGSLAKDAAGDLRKLLGDHD